MCFRNALLCRTVRFLCLRPQTRRSSVFCQKKFRLLSEEVQSLLLKKGNRGNSSDSVDTRVLFASLLGSQENWGNETCDRSFYSEQLPFGSPFQNGDQQIYQSLYSSRYIDHQTGPFGCLFPYPNFFCFQEKFLRFVWNNKVYQFLAVPFGLADAPQVFTRGFQTVISHLHTPSVQAHSYLDDSLLKEFDSEILSRHTYLFIFWT